MCGTAGGSGEACGRRLKCAEREQLAKLNFCQRKSSDENNTATSSKSLYVFFFFSFVARNDRKFEGVRGMKRNDVSVEENEAGSGAENIHFKGSLCKPVPIGGGIPTTSGL